MRERARDKGRLEDIVEYSNNVSELIKGFTLDSFEADIHINPMRWSLGQQLPQKLAMIYAYPH